MKTAVFKAIYYRNHMIFAHIARVLRHDGRLLISIPNAGEFHRIGRPWIGFRVDLEHINYFDLHSLSELLRQQDFYVENYWHHNQPSIGGRDITQESCRNFSFKMYKWLFNCLRGRVFGKADLFKQGSFVLTVLARKI